MAEKFGWSGWQEVGFGVVNLSKSNSGEIEIGRLRDGCDQPLPPFDEPCFLSELSSYIRGRIRLDKVVREEIVRICSEHNVEPTMEFLDYLAQSKEFAPNKPRN